MPYDEIMEPECRLGHDNLHVIPVISENLPPHYVVVQYTCPCGQFTARFALHRYVLYHLMGRNSIRTRNARIHSYLQMLSALQAEAIASEPDTSGRESPER